MSRARPSPLVAWLVAHGAMIDRDASVSVHQTKNGQSITFSWTYAGGRSVRLTLSGVKPEERNAAMLAWLNGEFQPEVKA